MKGFKGIFIGIIVLAVVLYGAKYFVNNQRQAELQAQLAASAAVAESVDGEMMDENNPVDTIEMEDGKIIKVELYPDVAPNTVANFVELANSGYYDGIIFHRIIENFMVQGGDPTGTGMGGPGYAIKGEFTSNGFENNLSHTQGVISMARSGEPDSAGSQFFIVHGDASFLDGEYAAFGKVIEGFKNVDLLAKVETVAQDKPTIDQVMKSVTIEMNGYTQPEVEKLAE